MNSPTLSSFWTGCSFLGLLLLAGCGGVQTDYSQLDLKEIRGTITLDGTPLAEAVVRFESPDGSFSYGTTDASGNYTLMLNSEKRGVMPGPKVVRISTTGGLGEEAEGEVSELEGGGNALANRSSETVGGEKVPPCYNRNSKLRVNVERSAKLQFDLKSDCSVTGPTD